MTNFPQTRGNDLAVQTIDQQVLVYDFRTNKAYCLNQTSSMIWNLCNGKNSITEIAGQLSRNLKEPVTEDVVRLALDDFKKENLLQENERFATDFNGLSRRQVIRKIGLASMIALPVIYSIVAPSAANAQSGGARLGAACGSGCAAGLACRNINFIGGGPTCCVPGQPFAQTFPPREPLCATDCPSATAFVCCSGSGTPAPSTSFCSNQGFVTCTCNPY